MRFEDLLGRWAAGTLSHSEAAALGVSERTFRRWRGRHAEDGAVGLVDRRVGKPSPRRAPADELQRMLKLDHEYDAGFAIRHSHDRLRRRHGYTLGDTTTRLWLQKSGVVAAAAKRGAHRRKRPRRAMVGMLLHQDASTHAWLVRQPALDCLARRAAGPRPGDHDRPARADPSAERPAPSGAGGDDATSAIYAAVLVEEEGTASTLRGLSAALTSRRGIGRSPMAEVIERHGLFIELYTDRGSHYFHTPEAGGTVSRTHLTPAQAVGLRADGTGSIALRLMVGRALKQLGIGHIAAYSPQARGRCERAFRTSRVAAPSPEEPIAARSEGRTGCRKS